jgi:hypothetical protein
MQQVNVPFGLNHIAKLQINLRIHRFHVLVQAIEQRNTGRDGKALNVFVADIVNILHQRSNRIGVTNNNTFVARPHRRNNH